MPDTEWEKKSLQAMPLQKMFLRLNKTASNIAEMDLKRQLRVNYQDLGILSKI